MYSSSLFAFGFSVQLQLHFANQKSNKIKGRIWINLQRSIPIHPQSHLIVVSLNVFTFPLWNGFFWFRFIHFKLSIGVVILRICWQSVVERIDARIKMKLIASKREKKGTEKRSSKPTSSLWVCVRINNEGERNADENDECHRNKITDENGFTAANSSSKQR